jgi:cell division protein FtsW (lipid II flippase)
VPRAATQGRALRRRQRQLIPRRRIELGLLTLASIIILAAYILASIGKNSHIPANLGPFLAILLGLGIAAHIANRFLAPDANPSFLPIAFLLNGLGYVMIARIGPVGDQPDLARLQAAWTAAGVAVYIGTLLVIRRSRDLDRYRYLLLLAGVILLLSPLIPHVGEDVGGVRLWIHLGPINGQPVEVAKLALCVFFASYFTEKRELLSVPTFRLGNRLVLDPRPMIPILLAWGFAMLILTKERDIGFALLIFVLFVVMLWLATGRAVWMIFGIALFVIGAVIANHSVGLVHDRVADWLHPWSNTQAGPTQLQEGLYGMGSGGLLGTGLGLGQPGSVPLATTDFIFSAFGEEMGFLGTTLIVVAFMLLIGAGLRTAQIARSEFSKMMAAGLTAIIGFQAFFIMAGVIDLLPLTGITLPFMAYGGSSLVANYALIAILVRISDEGVRAPMISGATGTRLVPSTASG